MKLKNNKGITGIDITISALIFIVFVSMIATLFFNLSSSANRLERKSTATNIAIEVIEALKVTDLSLLDPTNEGNSMTLENLNEYTSKNINVPNGYTVTISIEIPVKEGIEESEMRGFARKVTVDVSYQANKKTENVKISTLVKNI